MLRQDVVSAARNRGLALERVGLAPLVKPHHHDGCAVAAHDAGLANELRLAFLEGDRIHHRLALQTFEPGYQHRELRGVDHHRHTRDVRLSHQQVEKRHHSGLRVEQAFVHVDVDDLGTVLDLIARDRERPGKIAGLDQLAKARRAGDVGALADIHEWNFRRERERFETREPKPRRDPRDWARRLAGDRAHDGPDVFGRAAAAAADDVDETGGGEFLDLCTHHRGALVISPERVWQAGVGIGADQRVGDLRHLGDVGPQLAGAERTVRNRVPERGRGLPREQASGTIGDGARDHDRHTRTALLANIRNRVERRLGVERVENGLDQQDVGAAVEQPADLLRVSGAQLIEGDCPETRVGYVRRD